MARITSIALLVALSLAARPAAACGGFFCNGTQPVNQAAERIIFSVADDGTVTATIQIQYSGDAASFAWVLPVAGSPTVRVSSNLAFARLQSMTNPSYLLTTRVEGTCSAGGPRGFPGAAGRSDAAAAAVDAAGGPVTVVESGSVGPYDYIVISVDATTPLPTDSAVAWLEDNGYTIDPAGAELLAPYLEAGMNLLAFRLTSGRSVGSIRPVEITFGPGAPAIPLRPTAVAAVADMGVMVWVLGESRAIPLNYMSLELNEALINWLNPGPTYGAVVTEAANQAGGQGFVTEMAGPAAPLAETVMPSWELSALDDMRASDWDGGELLQVAFGQFGQYDGFRDAVADTVPIPADRTLEELLACVWCVYSASDDIPGFDRAAFLDAVELHAVEPMRRTRALFVDHAYVTRFYTTMSAAEMDRDPMFAFTTNLGDVSNVHGAERVFECSPSIGIGEAPWRVELEDGTTVRGTGSTWPFTPGDGSMPANLRIVRLEPDAPESVVVDNEDTIASALDDHNRTVPRVDPRTPGGAVCSAGRGSSAMLAGLALSALVLVVRRRR